MRRTALGAALLTLGFAATSMGLTAGPASAADECGDAGQSCVIVKVVSTKNFKTKRTLTHVVSTDDMSEWSDLAKPKSALSLRELLTKVGEKRKVDLIKDVRFSETLDPDGVPRTLDGSAFSDKPPFVDKPSVYPLSGGRIAYFKPQADEDDDNGSERLIVKGPLTITIHTTGKLLAPTATVSNSAPTTKDEPTFSAAVDGKSDRDLKYRWDFGDNRGPGRTSKSPTHRYTKKGSYGAFVTVRGDDGSYGRSAVLSVKVGKPPKTLPSPTTGSGGGVRGNSGGYVPPYNPPSTNLPAPAPNPIDEPLEDDPADDIPVDDGLIDVEGYVLAGSEIVPGGVPEAIPGTQASSSPTPASETSVRKRIATWAVAALAIVLLVGAGATSETRWFRNSLRHLRRRA